MYQGTDYTEDRQVFPWDPFQGVPGDRLHRGRTSLPLGPFSESTRGQTTQRTDKSSPGTIFMVLQGTDYIEDGQVFSWNPFQGAPGDRLHRRRTSLPLRPFSGCTRGQTTHRTDKSSPGTLFRVYQGTDYTKANESSPGTLFRVHQGTDYTEDGQVFPWDPFQGAPGDRLCRGQTSLPLGPFSGCTRGQTT